MMPLKAGERAAREVMAEMGYIGSDQIWQIEPESKVCFFQLVVKTLFFQTLKQ